MQSLTLFLPGLIWPFNRLNIGDVPRFPALDRILSKSDKYLSEPEPFYSQLCFMFGLLQEEGKDLPLAALSRLIDDAGHPEGYWLRADPVNLETVRDGLCLLDSNAFSVTQHDAILLGALLKDLFDDYGWHFEIPEASRWYLQLSDDTNLSTTEISMVRGNDVQLYMPRGDSKSTIVRLMTEVQMTLHECQFNQERERKGERPINSLWFWGGGVLPEILTRKWSSVVSDDAVVQGLSILSGTPFSGVQNNTEDFLFSNEASGEHLLVRDELLTMVSYQDYSGWLDTITIMEECYFKPLLTAMENGDLAKLTISSGTREFELNKSDLRKFWKRNRPISSYCQADN